MPAISVGEAGSATRPTRIGFISAAYTYGTGGIRTRAFCVDPSHDDNGRSLVMTIHDKANVESILGLPASTALPGLHPKGGAQIIDRAYLWANHPADFLAAMRQQIGSRPNTIDG